MTRISDRRRPAWALALVSTATFMTALDILAVSTALDQIRRRLDVGVGDLEWIITGYNIAFAGLMLLGAALGDRFGRRRMLLIGIVAFTAGSVVCAIAGGLPVLLGGRVLQGIGAALVTPLAVPLISAAYPTERRGRAFGIQAGVTGLATIGGPLIGGLITGLLDWHWIFWINVPVGIALIPLVLAKVPEAREAAGRLDILGAALGTAALTAMSAGLVAAADRGSGIASVAGITAGVLLAGMFVLWERRCAHPLLPIGVLRHRAVAAVNLGTVLHSVVVVGAVFVMAQYLQSGLGFGVAQAGLAVLPWTGSMLFVAPLAGRLTDRIGAKAVAVGGLVLSALGYAAAAVVAARPESTYWVLVVPLVVVGVGNSAVFPALGTLVAGTSPTTSLGAAAGLNSSARELGAVLGVALVAIAFTSTGSFADHQSAASGFAGAMVLCAAAAIVAAAACWIIPRPGSVRAVR